MQHDDGVAVAPEKNTAHPAAASHCLAPDLRELISGRPDVANLILAHFSARFLVESLCLVARFCRDACEDDALWLELCSRTCKPAVRGATWRQSYWSALCVPADYNTLEEALYFAPDYSKIVLLEGTYRGRAPDLHN